MVRRVKTNACNVPMKKLKNCNRNGTTAASSEIFSGPTLMRETMIVAMTNIRISPTKTLKNKRSASVTGRANSSITLITTIGANGLNRCEIVLRAVAHQRDRLNHQEDDDGIGRGRIQVGGRGAAEGQSEQLEREEADLVQDEDEEKQRDEERDERLAAASERADGEIAEIVHDAFEGRLRLVHANRAIRIADIREERKRDDHHEPRRENRIDVHLSEEGHRRSRVFADFFVH